MAPDPAIASPREQRAGTRVPLCHSCLWVRAVLSTAAPGSREASDAATNPQIVCPNSKTQIPVTDALAGPSVADARRRFEQQLATKEADFGRREDQLREAQSELSKARETRWRRK